MKVFSLFFILIFALAYGGVSCSQPTTSELGSERDDDDHDDDVDNRHTRTCSDRDSCQDICDDLFSYTTERYNCYDLNSDEVNTISKVSDELEHNDVNPDELEDLDADDVQAYLEIGFESFIDLIKGEAVGDDAKAHNQPQWNNMVASNSKEIMEWIAETEDIAEVILEQDSDFELGLELFQAVAIIPTDDDLDWKISTKPNWPRNWLEEDRGGTELHVCIGNTVNYGASSDDSGVCTGVGNGTGRLLDLGDFDGVDVFLSGFLLMRDFPGGDSFMVFSADERNETAFEWGHKTLLEFCKEATDEEDESDVEVKICLQTAYCIHRSVETGGSLDNSDGIFKNLDDYDDIVGQTKVDNCGDLLIENRIEKLFD